MLDSVDIVMSDLAMYVQALGHECSTLTRGFWTTRRSDKTTKRDKTFLKRVDSERPIEEPALLGSRERACGMSLPRCGGGIGR